MTDVDAGDVEVDGATGTTVTITPVSGSVYDVTLTGGDLATFNGEVETAFNENGVSIQDTAGNDVALAPPTGTDNNTFQLVNELIPPRLVSIDRANPTSETTGEDALTWRVIFNEDVTGVDPTDFNESGTTATVSNVSAVSATTYDISVSGGDLANLVGTVTLSPIAGITNIQDISGNGFVDATPTTTNNNTYNIFNDIVGPLLTSITRQSPTTETTGDDSVTWRLVFNETVVNVDISDFGVTGTTATVTNVSAISATTYDVTVSGGDLANIVGTITLNPISSGNDIQDSVGNSFTSATPTGTNENTYNIFNDIVAPFLSSITRQSPTTEVTDADSLTWRFVFSEPVVNVDVSDFDISGTTARISIVSAVSSTEYDVTALGGDLALLNAVVQVSLNSSASIEDAVGLTVSTASPSVNENTFTLVNDVAPPRIVSVTRHNPSTETTQEGTLIWQFTFDEAVTGVDTSNFIVSGTTGAVTNVEAVLTSVYNVTVTGGDLATIAATVSIDANASGTPITDENGNLFNNGTPTGTNQNSYNIELPISSTTVQVVTDEGKQVSDGGSDAKPDEPTGSTVTNTYTFTNTSSDPITIDGTPTITGSNNVDSPTVSNFSTPVTNSLRKASLTFQQRSFAFAEAMTLDVLTAISNAVITPAYASGTITLQPGESTSFDVTFRTQAHGTYSVDVDIVSSVGTFDIEVSGAAVDTTAPTVSIDGAPVSHDGAATFKVTFEFSEDVTGFDSADITLSNANISNFFAVDGNTYTADIMPTGASDITIDIASAVAIDAGSNPNIAATQVRISGGATVEETQTAIANFMMNRANNLLSNQPDMIGFLNGSNNQGGGPLGNLQLENDLNSETTLSFFTSRSKILQAREGGFGKGNRPTLGDPAPSFASAERFGDDSQTNSNLLAKKEDDHEPEPQGFNTHDRTGLWDFWTQLNGSKSNQTNIKSEFWSAYFGTHYFISNDLLVGVLTQFDWAEEINTSANSTVSGNGFMVGPYIAGKLKDQDLYYEARALWGQSSNNVTPIGTYTDSFETERWLARLKLQGSYDLSNQVSVKPEVSISYFEETQAAYTDTNSNLIPEQKISLGEFKFGPTITRSFDIGSGYTMRATTGLSCIANFSVRNASNSTSNAFADEDLRARIDGKLEIENEYGIRFTAAGYYDGIGASDFESYGGSLGLIIPIY